MQPLLDPTCVNCWNDQDCNKERYRKVRFLIRQRKLALLPHVMNFPFLEQREWTFKYTPDMDGTEDGVRYNFYLTSVIDMIIDLFEASHCSNYPDKPCDTICRSCMDRVCSVINVQKFLETHMSWCLAHSPYYQDRLPVFSQFMHQIVEYLPTEFS